MLLCTALLCFFGGLTKTKIDIYVHKDNIQDNFQSEKVKMPEEKHSLQNIVCMHLFLCLGNVRIEIMNY